MGEPTPSQNAFASLEEAMFSTFLQRLIDGGYVEEPNTVPTNALTFSDNTPLQLDDGSYLETTA